MEEGAFSDILHHVESSLDVVKAKDQFQQASKVAAGEPFPRIEDADAKGLSEE